MLKSPAITKTRITTITEEKPTGGDQGDEKAVGTHAPETRNIFMDEAVVIKDALKHPAELIDDQYRKNSGKNKDEGQLPDIFSEIAVVLSVKFDNCRHKHCGDDSGKEHKVQNTFCKYG